MENVIIISLMLMSVYYWYKAGFHAGRAYEVRKSYASLIEDLGRNGESE